MGIKSKCQLIDNNTEAMIKWQHTEAMIVLLNKMSVYCSICLLFVLHWSSCVWCSLSLSAICIGALLSGVLSACHLYGSSSVWWSTVCHLYWRSSVRCSVCHLYWSTSICHLYWSSSVWCSLSLPFVLEHLLDAWCSLSAICIGASVGCC